MKYRAKDIARELGVSPATVSLVINNKPGVGDEKRREITKKIAELGCDYLLKESSLNKGDIGFVIYKCGGQIIDEYPFFNYLSESIIGEIERNNYTTTMLFLDNSMPISERYVAVEEYRHVGYIVYAVEMYPEDVEFFEKMSVPCVFLDNPLPNVNVDSISVNNKLGINQAFEYLYGMGHRKIGYIRSKFAIPCFEERFESYEECMKEKGLVVNDAHVMNVGYLEAETGKDVEKYLEETTELPTAFLADNDLLSCRAVQVFKKMGIKVPEEISFVGFDNRPICSFIEPKVSTIQIPEQAMGSLAVKALVERLEGTRDYNVKYKIAPKLIKNESVAKIV